MAALQIARMTAGDQQIPAKSDPTNLMSASVIVALMEGEMRRLFDQETALHSRIKGLRRGLCGAEPSFSDAETGLSNGSPKASVAGNKPIFQISHDDSALQYVLSSASRIRLQRACRIALLEVETSAPVKEIYNRIVARQSFSFPKVSKPMRLLVRELEEMARNGEIVYSTA